MRHHAERASAPVPAFVRQDRNFSAATRARPNSPKPQARPGQFASHAPIRDQREHRRPPAEPRGRHRRPKRNPHRSSTTDRAGRERHPVRIRADDARRQASSRADRNRVRPFSIAALLDPRGVMCLSQRALLNISNSCGRGKYAAFSSNRLLGLPSLRSSSVLPFSGHRLEPQQTHAEERKREEQQIPAAQEGRRHWNIGIRLAVRL